MDLYEFDMKKVFFFLIFCFALLFFKQTRFAYASHCLPLGDVNCSSQVDAFDLTFFVLDFLNFNERSDLDDSGKITTLDSSTLFFNFGKSATLTPTLTPPSGEGDRWLPTAQSHIKWDWLIGLNNSTLLAKVSDLISRGITMVDVDGFEISAATVAVLHQNGIKVVCYMDIGNWEPYRHVSSSDPSSWQAADADAYHPDLLGTVDPDWNQERFLDIRDVFRTGSAYLGLRENLHARFQMCEDKGFDAVEPDYLDNFSMNLAFNQGYTSAQINEIQINFDGWVSDAIHAHGLSSIQKNAPQFILSRPTKDYYGNPISNGPRLVDKFDFILNEQCFEYSECSLLLPYVSLNKAVFEAEYKSSLNMTNVCSNSATNKFNTIRKNLDLTYGSSNDYFCSW